MTVRVRRASQSQLSVVKALNTQVFPDNPMKESTYASSVWWLAWDGNTPVGYAGLYTGTPGETWLVRVGVVETHRRLGLGWRLVSIRLRHWRQALAATRLRTYVADWNIGSHKNVIRAGLVPYKSYKGWVYYELSSAPLQASR